MAFHRAESSPVNARPLPRLFVVFGAVVATLHLAACAGEDERRVAAKEARPSAASREHPPAPAVPEPTGVTASAPAGTPPPETRGRPEHFAVRAAPPPPDSSPAPPPAAFDVDAFLDSLPEGAVAFNAPPTVPYGEVARVRLVVQPGEEAAALVASFEAGRTADETGEVRSAIASLSADMEARLVSSTLELVAVDPPRQLVSARRPTEWRWDVKGSVGGRHRLALTLYAIPPGNASVRAIRSFEAQLEVDVPFGSRLTAFLGGNWQWLWTVLVAPFGGWAYARYRRRRGGGPPAAPPSEKAAA